MSRLCDVKILIPCMAKHTIVAKNEMMELEQLFNKITGGTYE